MSYTEAQMAEAAQTLLAASAALHVGGVVVGESHDSAHSRGLACTLINRNLVDRLFFELPDMPIEPGDGLQMPPGVAADAPLGTWLRGWAARPEDERNFAMNHASWVGFRYLRGRYDNAVPLIRLFAHAVKRGVNVYLIDVQNPGRMTDAARDEFMAARIGEVLPGAQDRVRNLVITGDLHHVETRLAGVVGVWKRLEALPTNGAKQIHREGEYRHGIQ